MLSRRLAALAVFAGLLAAAPVVRAQETTVRVAVCNPAKVFSDIDERKVIEDRMKLEAERIRAEVSRQQAELTELKKQRDYLNPDSEQYKEKNNQLAEALVKFRVWAEVKQAEQLRMEKEQIMALYNKIREATKQVAQSRNIDLVLSQRQPEINLDQLNPDQLRSIIVQNDVLYANQAADITQAVIVLMNTNYAKSGGVAPAPATSPESGN